MFLRRDFLIGSKNHHAAVIIIVVVSRYRTSHLFRRSRFRSIDIALLQHCQKVVAGCCFRFRFLVSGAFLGKLVVGIVLGMVVVPHQQTIFKAAIVRFGLVHGFTPGRFAVLAEKWPEPATLVDGFIAYHGLVLCRRIRNLGELVSVFRIHKGPPHHSKGVWIHSLASGGLVVYAESLFGKGVGISVVCDDPSTLELGIRGKHFFLRPPRRISRGGNQTGIDQGLVVVVVALVVAAATFLFLCLVIPATATTTRSVASR